jgi:NAD(P)-dependent dehydrogenase (short-subunit alcohol dehydrogenase family)
MKIVLITGGAKRLGAEMCWAFAQKGWGIACHYNASAAEAQALQEDLRLKGFVCEVFACDLANDVQVKRLTNEVIQRFRRLDCIINNASIFEPDNGIDFTSNAFLMHQKVNVLAPSLLTQAAAIHAKNSQQIVSILHILDQKVDNLNPDYYSYTVSKLALRDSVKLQAQAFAPYLRVNGLSPGLIYVSGPQTQENFLKAASVNLLKRPTPPSQVAKAALDLVENTAINGAILNVDSGQHLVPLARDVMFIVDEL